MPEVEVGRIRDDPKDLKRVTRRLEWQQQKEDFERAEALKSSRSVRWD